MRVLAHRGYHAAHPQNTLPAFNAALAAGADGFETDVRIAGDGQAVLFHDRLDRRGRPVAELSRDDLSLSQGYRVPTLDEALRAFPGAFWNLELKDSGALAALAGVAPGLRPERVMVTSFLHPVAVECARTLGLPAGLLIAHRPLAVHDLLFPFAPWPGLRTVVWDANVVEEELLRDARDEGWQNWVYGAVTAAEHRRWREAGVTALITDEPRLAGGA